MSSELWLSRLKIYGLKDLIALRCEADPLSPYRQPTEVLIGDSSNFQITSTDVGDVAEGTVVKTTFRVRNESGRNLQVVKVEPDCSCTLVSASSSDLVAGGSVDVQMNVSTAQKFSGFRMNAFLQLSNGVTRILSVNGTSHARWSVEPAQIDFGRLDDPTKALAATIRLAPTKYSSTHHLVRAKVDSGPFQATLGTADKDGQVVATIKFDPDGVRGEQASIIQFFESSDGGSIGAASVKGKVEPMILVQPSNPLVRIHPQQTGAVKLHLSSALGKRFHILHAASDADEVKVDGADDRWGTAAELEVRSVNPINRSTSCTVNITIGIDGLDREFHVKVPVVFLLESAARSD